MLYFNKISAKILFASSLALLSQTTYSADVSNPAPTLDDVSNATDPIQFLKNMNPTHASILCQLIKDKDFFSTPQAQKMGAVKSRKVSTYCHTLKEGRKETQVNPLRMAAPTPSHETKHTAVVHRLTDEQLSKFRKQAQALAHVPVGVEAQQEQLQQAEAEVATQVEHSGKMAEYKQQFEQIQQQTKNAKEHVETIKMLVNLMKEDLPSNPNFSSFAKAHANDTIENYLVALKAQLASYKPLARDQQQYDFYKDQVEGAHKQLMLANESFEKARGKLKQIIQEISEHSN